MMKSRSEVDFFSQEFKTEFPQNTEKLGIVDGNSSHAYTLHDKREMWNAEVDNQNKRLFTFIPIDYNIEIDRGDGCKESTCDGMILCEEIDFLSFVELKKVRAGGDADARKQLKNTIIIFNERHDYKRFNKKNRRAYVANREHPYFHKSEKNVEEEFRDVLHFRLFQQFKIELP